MVKRLNPTYSGKVVCHLCGFEWTYRGCKDIGEWVTCPNCGLKTKRE